MIINIFFTFYNFVKIIYIRKFIFLDKTVFKQITIKKAVKIFYLMFNIL